MASEIDLVNAIRSVSVGAVNARSKPVSVQVGEYIGDSRVNLGSGIDVDVIIPKSVQTYLNPNISECVCRDGERCPCIKQIERGDKLLLLKQEGQYKYFVVAVI